MIKKILCLILSASMILSLIPIMASAEIDWDLNEGYNSVYVPSGEAVRFSLGMLDPNTEYYVYSDNSVPTFCVLYNANGYGVNSDYSCCHDETNFGITFRIDEVDAVHLYAGFQGSAEETINVIVVANGGGGDYPGGDTNYLSPECGGIADIMYPGQSQILYLSNLDDYTEYTFQANAPEEIWIELYDSWDNMVFCTSGYGINMSFSKWQYNASYIKIGFVGDFTGPIDYYVGSGYGPGPWPDYDDPLYMEMDRPYMIDPEVSSSLVAGFIARETAPYVISLTSCSSPEMYDWIYQRAQIVHMEDYYNFTVDAMWNDEGWPMHGDFMVRPAECQDYVEVGDTCYIQNYGDIAFVRFIPQKSGEVNIEFLNGESYQPEEYYIYDTELRNRHLREAGDNSTYDVEAYTEYFIIYNLNGLGEITVNYADEVELLGATISETSVYGGKNITISTDDAADIYYSTDNQNFSKYTKEIFVDKDTTIYAYTKSGDTVSETSQKTVTVAKTKPPVISPASGEYLKETEVTITAENDAKIYYKTSGEFSEYKEKIILDSGKSITAYAEGLGTSKSDEVSVDYTISKAELPEITEEKTTGGKIISISSKTEGATLIYTLDGSDPKAEASEKYEYKEPFTVTKDQTVIKVYTYSPKYQDSDVKEYVVEVKQLPEPVFSITESNVYIGDKVSITSENSEEIRYTLNGENPTKESALYEAPIEITDDIKIKAYASAKGYTDSNVAEKSYTVYLTAKPQVIKEKAGYEMKISLKSETENATIYYTVDGSEPTLSSPVYKEPFKISKETTVKAFAVSERRKQSEMLDETIIVLRTPDPTSNFPSGQIKTTDKIVLTGSENAKIYYTIDATEPTEESILYTGPFSINKDTVIKAFAVEEDYLDSNVVTFKYTLPKNEKPNISYDDKTEGGVNVEINTDDEFVVIYYTLDGSDPTTESLRYIGPFEIKNSTVVKAIAVKEGWLDSEATEENITLPRASSPKSNVESGEYPRGTQIILTAESGLDIYYKTDSEYVKYTEPLILNSDMKISAYAVGKGILRSEVLELSYTVAKADAPTFKETDVMGGKTVAVNNPSGQGVLKISVNGGEYYTYTAPVKFTDYGSIKAFVSVDGVTDSPVSEYNIEMQSAKAPVPLQYDSGAVFKGEVLRFESYNDERETVIYYTLDGTDPDENSLVYTNGIEINAPFTIRLCAYALGRAKSDISEYSYTLRIAEKPQLKEEKAKGGKKITLSSTTPEAFIYYTLDGSDPKQNEKRILYDAPFIVGDNGAVIKAYAVSGKYLDSEVLEYTVEIGQLAAPVFDRNEATLFVGDKITITGEEIADIYYTTDGSTPDKNSTLYTEPIVITDDIVLKAIAYSEGWQTSNITEKTYSVYVTEAPYIVRTKDGNAMRVEIKTLTDDATIYYTINGDIPDEYSRVYTSSITFTQDTTIKAIAVSQGRKNSSVTEELVLVRHTDEPVADIPGGEVKSGDKITLSAKPGAVIYYTLDGSNPTEESNVYKSEITITKDTVIKAFAAEDGYLDSKVVTISYTVAKTVNPEISFGEDIWGAKTVVITSATEGADIYYTLDGSNPLNGAYKYVKPIEIKKTTFVRAYAVKEGYADSEILGKDMVVPVAELNNTEKFYVLTTNNFYAELSEHPVRYTLGYDKEPDEESEFYVPGTLKFDDDTRLNAYAIDYGYAKSEIKRYFIIIRGTGLEAKFTYSTEKTTVKLESIEGAEIRYTLDGTDPLTNGMEYTDPFDVTKTTQLRAYAAKEGYRTSVINQTVYVNRAKQPYIASDSSYYSYRENYYVKEGSKISLHSNQGLNIRYTLDGTIPTETNGIDYKEPFTVNESTTILSYAYGEGYEPSEVNRAYVSIMKVFASLSVNDVENGKQISITPRYGSGKSMPDYSYSITSSSHPNYTVYYTLDGSDPTVDSPVWAKCENGIYTHREETIFTSETMVIKTLVVAEKSISDGIFEETVEVLKLNVPSFAPADTSVYKNTYITLENGEEGASIYYTLDGETPTSESELYEGPFAISDDVKIRAIAIKRGMKNSPVLSVDFKVKQAPIPELKEEMTASGKLITLTSDLQDVRIYYAINGDTATENSILYEGPFKLKETTILSYIAVTDNLKASQQQSKLIDVPFSEMAAIYTEDINASRGEYIEIPLYIQKNPGIAAYSLNVEYDTKVLKPVSATNHWGGIFVSNIDKGEDSGIEKGVSMTWLGSYNTNTDGEVVTLGFEVLNNASSGVSLLTIKENGVIDALYNIADIAYMDGKVNVSSSYNYLGNMNMLGFSDISSSTHYTDTKFTMITEKVDEDTLKVDVVVSENSGIGAYDISLSYNNELLTPVNVINGDLFESDVMTNVIQPNYNPEFLSEVTVISVNDKNTEVNGKLFTVEFKINSPVYPEHLIEFADVQLNTVEGDRIIGIYEDSVIKEEYKIELDILSELVMDENNNINGIDIEISNDSEKTSAVLIVAMFDNYNKRTVNTVIKPVTLKKGKNLIENISIKGTNDLKQPCIGVYLWKSLDTLMPYATIKKEI